MIINQTPRISPFLAVVACEHALRGVSGGEGKKAPCFCRFDFLCSSSPERAYSRLLPWLSLRLWPFVKRTNPLKTYWNRYRRISCTWLSGSVRASCESPLNVVSKWDCVHLWRKTRASITAQCSGSLFTFSVLPKKSENGCLRGPVFSNKLHQYLYRFTPFTWCS